MKIKTNKQPAAPVAQVSDLFPSVRNKLHSQGFDADAPLFTRPAPGVPDDVVRDAIAAVREQYRGTDWGKAAECICDAIDAAMLALRPAQKGD